VVSGVSEASAARQVHHLRASTLLALLVLAHVPDDECDEKDESFNEQCLEHDLGCHGVLDDTEEQPCCNPRDCDGQCGRHSQLYWSGFVHADSNLLDHPL
jgi:hypothetical protein